MADTPTTPVDGQVSPSGGSTAPQGTGIRFDDSPAWVALLVVGVISALTGIAILIWPQVSLRIIAVMVGLWLLITGIAWFIGAFASESEPRRRVLSAITGVILVIAGAACLRDLVKAMNLLALVIAIAWIFSGLAGIVMGLQERGGRRVSVNLLGLATIIIGCILLLVPSLSLATFILFAGLGALIVGVTQVVVAFLLRSSRHGA